MLSRENTGLILVDVQGKLARLVHESERVIAQCETLVQGAKALALPILWLEQNREKLGATVESLSLLLTGHKPIVKFTFDACEEVSFMRAVRDTGRTSWLICGIEAHICVYQTALHLRLLNYQVQLVGDCISSRYPANIQLAKEKLLHSGVGLTGVEMCLYELVKDCRAPEFREILALIK